MSRMTPADALSVLDSVWKYHHAIPPEVTGAVNPVEVLRQEVVFLRAYCGATADLNVPLDRFSSKPWPEVKVEVTGGPVDASRFKPEDPGDDDTVDIPVPVR